LFLYRRKGGRDKVKGARGRVQGARKKEDGRGEMDEKKTSKIRTVRDLKVYRKAFDNAMEIYELTKKFR